MTAEAGVTIAVTTSLDNTATDGKCSLREALLAANADQRVDACRAGAGADTVTVPKSTYQLKLGELRITSNVTVRGAGTANTIINGEGAQREVRAVRVANNGQLTLSGLTIQHARYALRNEGTLHLSSVRITACGGRIPDALPFRAVVDNVGKATIDSSKFDTYGINDQLDLIDNAHGATMIITRTAFQAFKGAPVNNAMVWNSGTMTVANSTVDQSAPMIMNEPYHSSLFGNDGSLRVSRVRFTRNTTHNAVSNRGSVVIDRTYVTGSGAFDNYAGTMTLTNSTIDGINQLYDRYGNGRGVGPFSIGRASGVVYNASGATLTMNSTTLANNTLYVAAGVRNDGTAYLADDTIVGNKTGEYGSDDPPGGTAIYNSGTLIARNATIVDNHGVNPAVVNGGQGVLRLSNSIIARSRDGFGQPGWDCAGVLYSPRYDLIEDASHCTFGGRPVGNITRVDPQLGPLGDNGGATRTMLPRAGSPVLDRGNPAAPSTGVTDCPSVDQREVTRPRDGDLDGVARCDIGATER